MSDLTVIASNMFISPGLVRTDELPVMDADIVELEHKVSLLLQTYNNKLYEQTSWPWEGVEVPYAQNLAKGLPWESRPIPGLLQYGEPVGELVDEDHQIGATPDAVRQVAEHFEGALPAQRTIQGKDLRFNIWVTGSEVGSLDAGDIVALAKHHRFPKELPGSDYAYVLSSKTTPLDSGDDKPITRILAISDTEMTVERKTFKVLVDEVWK